MNGRKLLAVVLSACCLVLASCGDGDGGDQSIDGATPISDLTADQRLQLCERYADTMNAVMTQEVTCLMVGIDEEDASGGTTTCEEVYDICIEDAAEVFAACYPDEIAADDLSGCSATADDLDDCLYDWAAAWQVSVSDLSCSSDPVSEPVLPASCAPFDHTECSDVMRAHLSCNYRISLEKVC
jgi:hypothetical protein